MRTELATSIELRSPRRYLDQLCAHLSAIGGMSSHPRHHGRRPQNGHGAPPSRVSIARDDPDHAVIDFGTATCDVSSANGVLRLVVRGEEDVNDLAASIAHRLETIGRREQVRVHWTPQTTDE